MIGEKETTEPQELVAAETFEQRKRVAVLALRRARHQGQMAH